MTKEEIIELAKQSGIDIGMWEKLSDNDDVFGYDFCGIHENLEAFAKLVADKERQWLIDSGLIGVLKHCEDLLREDGHDDAVDDVQNMIAKIKTRGQANG